MKRMKASLRTGLVASLVVGSVALAPLSWSAPTRIKATADDTWNPSPQHISRGTRVVWTNPEHLGAVHDVTAYGRGWDKRVVLQPGERTGKRFRKTGTYKYRCRRHSHLGDGGCHGMCGVIHVMR